MNLKPLISKESIAEKIAEVAHRLDELYAGDELVLVGVLKGAICLMADLMRHFRKTKVRVEFCQASSYGQRGTERGELTLGAMSHLDFTGKHVLLVDDIFDSGNTLYAIAQSLQACKPRSLRTLVLLEKQVPREREWIPDEVLFSIENRFVVGYGLDYKEHYRELSGVYTLVEEGS